VFFNWVDNEESLGFLWLKNTHKRVMKVCDMMEVVWSGREIRARNPDRGGGACAKHSICERS
jgi:hypothetical protein